MAFQLIYTSVPSGLVAGRSGFCTAARHRELSEGLASRIENISSVYDRGSQSGERGGDRLPVIYSHRIVDVRGDRAHLLMRIADAGSDYTGRTNHIAHTFILDPSEVARLKITPAEAILHLLRQGLWQTRYEEAAKYFGSGDIVDFGTVAPTVDLPAETWASLTGEAANAAHLLSSQASTGAAVVLPEGEDEETLLRLFAESACVAAPGRENGSPLWQRSFTSRLQESEKRSDFDWYGCGHNSPAHIRAIKSKLLVVEVARGMEVPGGRFAEIAEGKKPTEAGSTLEAATLAPTTVTAGSPAAPAQAKITATAPYGSTTPSSRSVPLEFGGQPHKRKKKKWLVPVAGCVGVLLLALVLVGIFLSGGGEIRDQEKAIEAKISEGDWAGAKGILGALEKEKAQEFANESDRFRALQSIVILAGKYQKIAANPEQTIGSEGTKGPSEFLQKVEKEAQNYKLDPALAQLRAEASQSVKEYEALTVELFKRSQMYRDGGPWSNNLASLSERALSLKLTEEGPVRRRIAVANAISDATAKFEGIRDGKYTDEKQVEKARLAKTQLSTSLSKINLPEDDPWKGSLADITYRIEDYKLDVYVPDTDIPDPTPDEKMADKGAEETEKASDETLSLIPKTYFRAFVPEHVYGYGDIGEFSEGFRDSAMLVPLFPYPPVEIKYNGLVNNKVYADTESGFKDLLSLDPNAKELSGDKEQINSVYQDGFLLAFGEDGAERPEFQIVYQSPSESPADAGAPGSKFFLELPLESVVKKISEKGTIGLAPETLAVLENVHFADSSPQFHVVVTGEEQTAPRVFSFSTPEDAKIDPAADLTQRINHLQGEIARLEAVRDADSKFKASPFPMLGKELFCDENGNEWVYEGLKIQGQGKGQGKKYRVVPDPSKKKKLEGSLLNQSFNDYETMKGDFIKGPPFVHYVNKHLFEHLRAQSEWGDRWKKFAPEIRPSSLDVEQGEESDSIYIENSIKGWKKITLLSQEKKWASSRNDYGVFPNEKGAEQEIRRVRKPYTNDKAFSGFFASWDKIFTPENFRVLEAYISGKTFDPAALTNAQEELKNLSASLTKAAETPLEKMGTFHIVVTTKDGVKEEAFRLISSSQAEE